MNFLEQLTAEWYQYQGYLVRTNIKFKKRSRGGWTGEMDVIAYKPKSRGFDQEEFIHLETSTDSDSWSKRKEKFEKKFSDARGNYMDIFSFKQSGLIPRQIALFGFNRSTSERADSWKSLLRGADPEEIKIEVIHIPVFIEKINARLAQQDPRNEAVPEAFPLLRAMQYSIFYSNEVTKENVRKSGR